MNPTQPALQLAEQKRRFWGNMIRISAISLVVSVCAGVAAPLVGMLNAFNKLKTAGAADPSALAADISIALLGSLVAIPFALTSLVLFIIAIAATGNFPIQPKPGESAALRNPIYQNPGLCAFASLR
jgi:hypothetical protein